MSANLPPAEPLWLGEGECAAERDRVLGVGGPFDQAARGAREDVANDEQREVRRVADQVPAIRLLVLGSARTLLLGCTVAEACAAACALPVVPRRVRAVPSASPVAASLVEVFAIVFPLAVDVSCSAL